MKYYVRGASIDSVPEDVKTAFADRLVTTKCVECGVAVFVGRDSWQQAEQGAGAKVQPLCQNCAARLSAASPSIQVTTEASDSLNRDIHDFAVRRK